MCRDTGDIELRFCMVRSMPETVTEIVFLFRSSPYDSVVDPWIISYSNRSIL